MMMKRARDCGKAAVMYVMLSDGERLTGWC